MKISNVTKIICSRWSLGLSGKRYTPQYCFWPPIYGHLSRKMMIDHQLLGAPKFQTNPSSKMGWWDVPNSQDGRWHWHWPKEQLEDLDDELATPSISVIRSLFTIQSSRAAGQQQGSRAAGQRLVDLTYVQLPSLGVLCRSFIPLGFSIHCNCLSQDTSFTVSSCLWHHTDMVTLSTVYCKALVAILNIGTAGMPRKGSKISLDQQKN